MDPEAARQLDRVILRQIPLNLKIGLDAWGRDKPQPVLLSLEIPYDVRKAAATDDVSHTLDYGKLYKSLTKQLVDPSDSAAELALRVRDVLQPVQFFQVYIVLPKGSLRAGRGLHFTFEFKAGERPGEVILTQGLSVKGIHCACIVGVNPHEREEKQIIAVNLDINWSDIFDGDQESLRHPLSLNIKESFSGVPHADVIRKVVKQVEGSTYLTVEALATAIAKTITVTFNIPGVWVEVEKPNAIAAIEAAGVRIYREKSFYTEENFWQIRQP